MPKLWLRRLASAMSSKLNGMLNELKSLQQRIEQEIRKDSVEAKLIQYFPMDFQRADYHKYVSADKKYLLVTLTFDPKVSNKLDESGQKIKLLQCMEHIRKYHYFACFEKHKSGILHAHIMISIDIHDMTIAAYKMLKSISTNQLHLEPAISIDVIKNKKDDKDRVYHYIWEHKKDHPIYKYIICTI